MITAIQILIMLVILLVGLSIYIYINVTSLTRTELRLIEENTKLTKAVLDLRASNSRLNDKNIELLNRIPLPLIGTTWVNTKDVGEPNVITVVSSMPPPPRTVGGRIIYYTTSERPGSVEGMWSNDWHKYFGPYVEENI